MKRALGEPKKSHTSMMSADNLPEDMRNKYGNLSTIIKVEKTIRLYNARNKKTHEQPRATTTVHYYISSLSPIFENYWQLVHSINVRWNL